MKAVILRVPNVLGRNSQAVERFYSIIESALPADQYTLDVGTMSFVKPYGVIALIIAARCLSGRSGQPVVVRRGSETLSGQALLDALPDFHLNDLEARLFGERQAEYHFEAAETDRKLIAAEMGDFVEAVRTRRQPESTGEDGLRAVALVYAMLESSLAGRPVTMAEILSGAVHEYQDRVEQAGSETG